MTQGTVVSIHIASVGAAPMSLVTEVEARLGRGLEGDRYAAKLGTYSHEPGSGRDLTLIEIEAIEALWRDYKITLEPGLTRRNIVTRACLSTIWSEKSFARCCRAKRHPSLRSLRTYGKLAVTDALRGLIHRGGLRAKIVKGGIIRVGDLIASPK